MAKGFGKKIGLRNQGFTAAHYSNFRFTKMDNPPMKGKAKLAPQPKDIIAKFASKARELHGGFQASPSGTVTSWWVLKAFIDRIY